MKATFFLCACAFSSFGFMSCDNDLSTFRKEPPAIVAGDCYPYNFDFRYAYNSVITDPNTQFIRVKVLEVIRGGIVAEVVSDLKGNYEGKSQTTIWVGSDTGLQGATVDFEKGGTYLVLCQSAAIYGVAYADDWVTLTCLPSSLAVKGETVSGYIYHPYDESETSWSTLQRQLDTYEDLKINLLSIPTDDWQGLARDTVYVFNAVAEAAPYLRTGASHVLSGIDFENHSLIVTAARISAIWDAFDVYLAKTANSQYELTCYPVQKDSHLTYNPAGTFVIAGSAPKISSECQIQLKNFDWMTVVSWN